MARILTIEDSLLSRRAIVKILRSDGYEILEAANGQQGLDMAATYAPDCILLDLLMPDLDGRDVLRTLRCRGILVPVIVITADVQRSSQQECLELGAIAVIRKLPNPEELKRAIAMALQPQAEVLR